MTWSRVFVLDAIVDYGFHLVVSDVDVVWLRDPAPLLHRYPRAGGRLGRHRRDIAAAGAPRPPACPARRSADCCLSLWPAARPVQGASCFGDGAGHGTWGPSPHPTNHPRTHPPSNPADAPMACACGGMSTPQQTCTMCQTCRWAWAAAAAHPHCCLPLCLPLAPADMLVGLDHGSSDNLPRDSGLEVSFHPNGSDFNTGAASPRRQAATSPVPRSALPTSSPLAFSSRQALAAVFAASFWARHSAHPPCPCPPTHQPPMPTPPPRRLPAAAREERQRVGARLCQVLPPVPQARPGGLNACMGAHGPAVTLGCPA